MKYIIVILVIALIGAGYIYKDSLASSLTGNEQKKEKKDKDKKKDGKETASAKISVTRQWQLPDRLKEISGLSYLDAERFVCVQDEEGVIFVYNTSDEAIEKEIPFGGAGDYEGITLAGNNVYVVRSDGTLFEIANWNSQPAIKQYKTGLSVKHNVEGLVYDKTDNRLLLAIKDNEPATTAYKGVYSFDLASKTFNTEPVYKISMSNDASKKSKKGFKPSAIARHPSTNELFVIDGPGSKLMIMDGDGNLKEVYGLGSSFEQPEGITFSPAGEMFISNEGVKEAGNITQITIKR